MLSCIGEFSLCIWKYFTAPKRTICMFCLRGSTQQFFLLQEVSSKENTHKRIFITLVSKKKISRACYCSLRAVAGGEKTDPYNGEVFPVPRRTRQPQFQLLKTLFCEASFVHQRNTLTVVSQKKIM